MWGDGSLIKPERLVALVSKFKVVSLFQACKLKLRGHQWRLADMQWEWNQTPRIWFSQSWKCKGCHNVLCSCYIAVSSAKGSSMVSSKSRTQTKWLFFTQCERVSTAIFFCGFFNPDFFYSCNFVKSKCKPIFVPVRKWWERSTIRSSE